MRVGRTRWVAVVGVVLAGLAACGAAPEPRIAGTAAPSPGPVRLLQLNLCNSGIAGCYTGRSTARAAAVIRAEAPDLVTLNEVCEDDLAPLREAFGAPGGAVAAFAAARNGRTGADYRCRNGQRYGIGLLSQWPSVPGSDVGRGIYPDQDQGDPEERAWLCLDAAAAPAVGVCTTHLAYTRRDVAAAQCRYLFGTVVAGLRARDGAGPVVVAGDLNLGTGDGPELAGCLSPGSALVDDGGAQHVVATPEFVVDGSRTIDLEGTTDHPGLLVTLAPPR